MVLAVAPTAQLASTLVIIQIDHVSVLVACLYPASFASLDVESVVELHSLSSPLAVL